MVTGQEDTNRVLVTAHLYVSSDNLVDAELHLKDLDILVLSDPNSQSGKAKKARKMNIRMISEDELIKLVQ